MVVKHWLCMFYIGGNLYIVKEKLSRFRPGQAFKASVTEVSRIYGESPHGGGKVVSSTYRPPYLIPPADTTGRGHFECDGTRAETRFRLSAKRTSPLKSGGGSRFSQLLAAEVCASAVVMLDTPCSEVV